MAGFPAPPPRNSSPRDRSAEAPIGRLVGISASGGAPQNLGSQTATLALTAVPGSLTLGNVNLPSQVAAFTLTATPGTVTPGPATLGAQTATLTTTAVPGTFTAANANLGSQVAVLGLFAVPGTVAPGNANLGSQVGPLTLTAAPGQVTVAADQLLPSQVAVLVLTATPGTVLAAGAPLPEPSPSRWQGVRRGSGLSGRSPVRTQPRARPKRMRVDYGPNGEMYLLEVEGLPDEQTVHPLPPVATTRDEECLLCSDGSLRVISRRLR